MANLNKATTRFKQLQQHYNNASLKNSLYYVHRLHGNFQQYLTKNYGIRLVNYELINKRAKNHIDKTPNLFVLNNSNQYRPLNIEDVSIINNIYRKYFQDSGEMDMRIFLLFDSKFGSKYISEKTGINFKTISNLRYDIRHGRTDIDKIDSQTKMTLENFYLNSRLATHISNQKLTFNV